MLETWSPETNNTATIDSSLLTKLIQLTELEAVDASQALEPAQIELIAGWLKFDKQLWLDVLAQFDQQQLSQLAIFFTVSEDQQARLQSGSNNPAIIILKLLKERNEYPEKDFIRQLKKMTTNRFIPYGAAL